ncbi:MAG: glycosyltransferase, partial [Nitrococcus sp.]|nr:glycosyltransferase [Nitrococcus sp.]
RALPLVRERFVQARLLLVGGGPQEPRLRALVEELGLGDAVRFTGRVPPEKVSRYYALVDAFIYPRRSIRLTELVTPLKPLEAMAQGKLVIASNVGGHRELIRDGETGFLFPPDSPEEIAAGIVRCLEAVERWPAIRQTARHFVERERSWSAAVRRYQDVYSEALGAVPVAAPIDEQRPKHEQADGQ